VISGEYFVVAAIEKPNDVIVANIKVGYIQPLYYRAHGLALVASLSEEEQKRILAGKNTAYSEQSHGLNQEDLQRGLNMYKEMGFVMDISPNNPMVKVLVSPILRATNQPVGVLYLIGIFSKAKVQMYGQKLTEEAGKLSMLLGGELP
jgi:DNA-binding IclR family transcriptional regulator